MNIRRFLFSFILLSLTFLFLALTTAAAGVDPERVIPLASSGNDRANSVAFSKDGKYIAAGTSWGVTLYDAQTLAQVRSIATGAWVRSLAFSPDGETLAGGLFDSTIKLWRISDGQLLRTFNGHTNWVRSISFSGDGSRLASASDDNTLRLWRVADGTPLLVIQKDIDGVRSVALSPDGETLAAGLPDGSIHLWRSSDGILVRTLAGHTDWVRCLVFSPDGSMLASGSFDKTIRIWSTASGSLLQTLEGHSSSVLAVAFSPDGATLASGSVDTTVRLWRVADGRPLHLLKGHTDFVFSVAFSPDGRQLASGANDNSVRLWALDALTDESAALPSTPTPEPAAQGSQPQNCKQCHHRRGEAQPARVIEVRCDACHQGGIGANFCPAFKRSPEAVSKPVHYEPVKESAGVPSGSQDLSVVIASPGNGETLYVRGTYSAPAAVTGQVFSSIKPLSAVTLRLDIWSGKTLTETLTAAPDLDGSFRFNLDINHGKTPPFLVKPSASRCAVCHVNYQSEGSLPEGPVRLVVTAALPGGGQATDERLLKVDVSQMASLEVNVVDASTGRPVPGLTVQAEALLYDWRSRYAKAVTGQDGTAGLQLEALTETSTVYSLTVPPVILNGIRYTSLKPVEVNLPAGAISAPPVTMKVEGQKGHISGQIQGPRPDVLAGSSAWAIELPSGPAYQAPLSVSGGFTFSDLPVGAYAVTLDTQSLAGQGLWSAAQSVDLAQSPVQNLSLELKPSPALYGQVQGTANQAVPFAWLAVEGQPAVQAADPFSGAFHLNNLPAQPFILRVFAPGYYSDLWKLDPLSVNRELNIHLTPRSETRRISWGSGQLILPPETTAELDGLQVRLDQGWLWGRGGGGGQNLEIRTNEAQISIPEGNFALGITPHQDNWLYLQEGKAEVRFSGSAEAIPVTGGQMIALKPGARPLPENASLLAALQPSLSEAPIPETLEPTLAARLRHALVRAGLGTAQFVTLITYFLILVALIAGPLSMVLWTLNKRRLHPNAH